MILVGQYDSPYVRRVAVSLRVLGFMYAHDTRSVFADFDAMRQINPLGRIPSLVLDDGEVLIDSAAILDWLDQTVGAERPQITAACMIRYVRMADPDLLAPGRCRALDALSDRCEAMPEFEATYPAAHAIPNRG